MHLHRDTVCRVLTQSGVRAPATPLCPMRIDPFRPFITQTLVKYPTLTAAHLDAMAEARGYVGGGDHFRHLIATPQPRPVAGAYLRLRTVPS